MAEKEVTHATRTTRLAPQSGAAGVMIKAAPYIFMGIEMTMGIAALLLVIHHQLVLAGKIILWAMIIAGSEYQWRRFGKGPSSFEDEFSTLSDIFSFAVVPGLLIYQLAFRGWGVLGLSAVFILVFSAMVRLSLYRIYNPMTVKRAYVGLPLIINAALIALLAQVQEKEGITPDMRLLLLVVITGLSFLSVSPIHYPNPAERPGFMLLGVLAVAGLFVPSISRLLCWVMMAALAGYILLAPLTTKKQGA